MPAMIPLGWFHTIMGGIAIVSAAVALARYHEISFHHRAGQIYLVTTLITAITALMIYQHGFFGPAHILAVATLIALAVGTVAATRRPFGKWSRQVQAFSFSATVLFHLIPAVTDALLRLPVGNPILDSFEHPVIRMSHLGLVVIFLVAATLQLRWVGRQSA